MIDEKQNKICHECVGDEFLKSEIQGQGKRGNCAYCRKSRKVVNLSWLAEEIHYSIEGHFYLTSNEPTSFEYEMLKDKESNYEWVRHGEEVNYIIQEIAEIDDVVANDVQEYLSFNFGGDSTEFEEDPYGDEACYKSNPPDTYGFRDSWEFFRQEIFYRARYFSQFAEQVLDELFGDLDSLQTIDGKSVICITGPSTKNPHIFRARVTQTHKSLDRVLKNPVKELAAPPPEYAKNGRMNAQGISVFYGATDSETCIAEVRPPVGSHVVIGKFEIVKEIRLLDLNRLSNIYAKGSCFDPEYKIRKGHAAFLKNLVAELTKPVMPEQENHEYLPTQVVAEYLAEKIEPRLAGLIFSSSQSESQERNIILFNNSCGVEPYDLPEGISVSVDYGWSTEEDYDDSITVFENSEIEISKDKNVKTEKNTEQPEYNTDGRDITLKLNVAEGISVMVVKRASYQCSKRYVTRLKLERNTNEPGAYSAEKAKSIFDQI